jgi:hypothetical protein
MQIRDIRDHMPRSAQTDPNKFPAYRYQPYPRMLTGEDGKPLRHKNGKEVIVNSEAEEAAFLGTQEQPIEAKTVSIDASADGGTTLQAAVAQPETSEDDTPAKRGPGRPPKLPQDLK